MQVRFWIYVRCVARFENTVTWAELVLEKFHVQVWVVGSLGRQREVAIPDICVQARADHGSNLTRDMEHAFALLQTKFGGARGLPTVLAFGHHPVVGVPTLCFILTHISTR